MGADAQKGGKPFEKASSNFPFLPVGGSGDQRNELTFYKR